MSRIALLIPHYNDIEGLHRSLGSISDIEPVDVVIVDDGSKVPPEASDLKLRYPRLARIELLLFDRNLGIEHALNRGLQFILNENKYDYVARLDCGDLCHPERFRIQREYLDQHSDVCLAGTWALFVDTEGRELFTLRLPVSPEEIEKQMFINNAFCHPSVMFRTSIIGSIGFYPTNYAFAEDYAYFFRFVRYGRCVNIPEPLVRYEVNPSGISFSKRKKQIRSRLLIIIDNWEWGIMPLWGLARNLALYFMPRTLVWRIKEITYR